MKNILSIGFVFFSASLFGTAYCGGSGFISVIETPENIITQQISCGVVTDAFQLVTPNGQTLYTSKTSTNEILALDVSTNIIAATILVGLGGQYFAMTPNGRSLYVGNRSESSVSVIDTVSNSVIATIATGLNPYWPAVTPDGQLIYVGNSGLGANSVSAIDTNTKTVTATIATAARPFDVFISPDGLKVYACTSPNISVIAVGGTTVSKMIAVGVNPNKGVFSLDGTRLYVPVGGIGGVAVIDTTTDTLLLTIGNAFQTDSSGGPYIAITADGTKTYSTRRAARAVAVISTASNTLIDTIALSTGPRSVQISPDNLLYVPAQITPPDAPIIAIIDIATDVVLKTLPLATQRVAFTPASTSLSTLGRPSKFQPRYFNN